MTLTAIAAVLVIMLASLAGVVFVWVGFGRWLEKNLAFLTSLAAGVFLVVSGKLVMHTLEESPSVSFGLMYILIGAVFLLLLFSALPFFHHHHEEAADHEHDQLDARRILFGDALHNLGDGLLLAVTFSISIATGIIAAIGVFFHELVQEISEFFVLRESGYSVRKALLYNFAVSSTILLGVLGGMVATETAEMVTPILLGITAGSFLVIVGHDLIPHSVRASRKDQRWWPHIVWFLIGVITMLAVMLLLGEMH